MDYRPTITLRISFLSSLAFAVCLCLLTAQAASAHPGNTAWDGGHYCWTNCEYWGEVYGQRHFHGGGYAGPSMYEQGLDEGQAHAETENLEYIESNAANEGSDEGSNDGSTGAYSSEDPSYDVCDEGVQFTNTPDPDFEDGFQEAYADACRDIYDAAYSTAYHESYESSNATYAAIITDSSGDATSSDSNDWLGMFVLGLIIGGPIILAGIGAIWEWIND